MRIHEAEAEARREERDGQARLEAEVVEPVLELGLALVPRNAGVNRGQLLKIEEELVEDGERDQLNQ